jgi:hypothetical protein
MVRRLNRNRKIQAKKIDMLCGDFVKFNRGFLDQLKNHELTLTYYEKILGISSLELLLDTTAEFIQDSILTANVAIYVQGSFKSHICDSQALNDFDGLELEKYFSNDLISHICGSYNCMGIDDLLEAGFNAGPEILKRITAVAIPFCQPNVGWAFIIVYRDSASPITPGEIKAVCSLLPGLSKAANSFTPAQVA